MPSERGVPRFCSAMVTHILKDINSVRSFVRAREGLATTDMSLVTNFVDGLIKMVSGAQHFGAAEACFVSDALEDSQYGAEGTKRIDARLKCSQTTGCDSRSHKGAPAQMLKNWWYFCTAVDGSSIRDQKQSFHEKMATLVERGNLLVISHYDQQALKWMIAMTLYI